MAKDRIPTLEALDRPEKMREVLDQEDGDDCLSCRIVGSGALFGLAGYNYWSGMNQLERQQRAIAQSKSRFGLGSRKFGVVAISAGLAWMGLWRAFK